MRQRLRTSGEMSRGSTSSDAWRRTTFDVAGAETAVLRGLLWACGAKAVAVERTAAAAAAAVAKERMVAVGQLVGKMKEYGMSSRNGDATEACIMHNCLARNISQTQNAQQNHKMRVSGTSHLAECQGGAAVLHQALERVKVQLENFPCSTLAGVVRSYINSSL